MAVVIPGNPGSMIPCFGNDSSMQPAAANLTPGIRGEGSIFTLTSSDKIS